MSSGPETRPGQLGRLNSEALHEEFSEVKRMLRGGDDQPIVDGRVTKILAWIAGVGSILVTAAAIWVTSTIVNVDKQVNILLDRPQPVSKEQYDKDRNEMIITVKDIQKDVNEIKLKQAQNQYGGVH